MHLRGTRSPRTRAAVSWSSRRRLVVASSRRRRTNKGHAPVMHLVPAHSRRCIAASSSRRRRVVVSSSRRRRVVVSSSSRRRVHKSIHRSISTNVSTRVTTIHTGILTRRRRPVVAPSCHPSPPHRHPHPRALTTDARRRAVVSSVPASFLTGILTPPGPHHGCSSSRCRVIRPAPILTAILTRRPSPPALVVASSP